MKPAPINQKILKPKIRLEYRDDYKFVHNTVSSNKLHTVCEEARCPNIFECWDRRTATIITKPLNRKETLKIINS